MVQLFVKGGTYHSKQDLLQSILTDPNSVQLLPSTVIQLINLDHLVLTERYKLYGQQIFIF